MRLGIRQPATRMRDVHLRNTSLRAQLLRGVPVPPQESQFHEYWIGDAGVSEGSAADKVGQWSGQLLASPLIAPVTANEPSFLEELSSNGRPGLRFDGVANFLEMALFDLSAFNQIDIWFVGERRSHSGSTQNVVDRDGPVRMVHFNRANARLAYAHAGNSGSLSQIDDTDTTLPANLRGYAFQTVIPNPAASELTAEYNEALVAFDNLVQTFENTNANLGAGQLRLCQRVSSIGGGNFAPYDVFFLGFAETTGDRAATATWIAETWGTP